MAEKVELGFRDRNPDILTSIANLSNDEVFTPPEIAKQLLDKVEELWAKQNPGANIWENPSVKFLDPFTKSGVFLREITSRLSDGLSAVFPDVQERINHITKNQVFGLATTTLTSLISRRSVYCSKTANGKHSITQAFDKPEGNIWFDRLEHTWVGGSGRLITADAQGKTIEKLTNGRCKYCGASQREYDRAPELESHAYALLHTQDPNTFLNTLYGETMKFDVVIGNPPYQLEDGGHSTSAMPIYNQFVEQAKKLDPTLLAMIIPSRWFAGGKGLDSFRDSMLNDAAIRSIDDFPDPSVVFPGVNIEGGVCYFLWQKGSSGDCLVTTHYKDGSQSIYERPLLEPGSKVFIRFNDAISIVRKVWPNGLDAQESFAEVVSARKPFGMDTSVTGHAKEAAGDYKLYKNGGTAFIKPSEVPGGRHLVDKWKVFISYAYGIGGKFPTLVLGKPILGAPGTVSSETYIAIGPFSTEVQARNAISYIRTKLFRLLVLLHKPTQHGTRTTYSFVPKLSFDEEWDDPKLYSKFGLSQTEIDFIESMIRPMEVED